MTYLVFCSLDGLLTGSMSTLRDCINLCHSPWADEQLPHPPFKTCSVLNSSFFGWDPCLAHVQTDTHALRKPDTVRYVLVQYINI